MHKTIEETERFLAEFLPRVSESGPEVVVCPPFTSLKTAVEHYASEPGAGRRAEHARGG